MPSVTQQPYDQVRLTNSADRMNESAHILVIDDDASIRRMMQLLLTDTGYRVSMAGSGEEALAYMDLVTPDIVLMDLMLPGIDGIELTRRIKSDPKRPFTPIILITARGDQRTKVAVLDAGADDILIKPVEFTELLARVRAMLRLQRSQRSLSDEQRKTELLLHLTRALSTSLDINQLLTGFLQHLSDAVGAARASIILSGDAPLRFFTSSASNVPPDLDNIVLHGVAGWVLREQQVALIDDTANDERWYITDSFHRSVRSAVVVPILRDNHPFGTITLVHHTPSYFNQSHVDLLTSVAAQCAFALQNAELFRLTQNQKVLLERRAEELQRINQASQLLTELMRPDQLMRLVSHLIQHTFNYPMVTILIQDHHDLVVQAVAAAQDLPILEGSRLSVNQGITGWVARNGEALLVPDTHNDERFISPTPQPWGRSELAVPIVAARKVIGVIDLLSDHLDAFGENDVQVMETLASQIGVALNNAQLFDTEKRRVRQLDQVNSLSVAITAQLDAYDNLRMAANAIALIFGVERCAILLRDTGDEQYVWIPSKNGHIRTDTTSFTSLVGSAIFDILHDTRSPQVLDNLSGDATAEPLRSIIVAEGVERVALVGLVTGRQTVGAITIDLTGHNEHFGQGELALLETVASLITHVIENNRLYQEVANERSTLNAVLDGAADPILLIGAQDHVLLANRAATEQLGIDQVSDQPVDSLVAQPDLLEALRYRNGQTGKPNEVVLDNNKTFSVSVAPVRSSEAVSLGRVAILQDITAIKELERREQERLRSVLRRYVSPQVVEQILAGGGEFGAPVEREVAVIFADLRNYTALTEGMNPQVLVHEVLNRYLNTMTDVFHQHEGTVDKFLGDGILGVFGTPIAKPDDLQRALITAVSMQKMFDDLRHDWQRLLGIDIGMGVSMGYGNAVVGNIGSTERLDYTLIGDVVNTTSRLNGLAHAGQIIVSHQLVDALPKTWTSPWPLRKMGRVPLKGKQEPHLIYEVAYTG